MARKTTITEIKLSRYDWQPGHMRVRVYLSNGQIYHCWFAGDVTLDEARAAFEQDRADRRLARNWDRV